MRVALLATKDTPRGAYLMDAFRAGLRVHGDEAVSVRPGDDLGVLDRCDAGMQICFPNRHHDGSAVPKFRIAAYQRLTELGRRVVTLDTGFLRSQPEAELRDGFNAGYEPDYPKFEQRIYYSVGFGGLKNRGEYHNSLAKPDRWDALGVELKPWRTGGRHVLLVGQPLHGISSQHTDVYAWYAQVAAKLAKHLPGVPVVYRPHPRVATIRSSPKRRAADEKAVRKAVGGLDLRYSANRFLEDDLADARLCVTLTSNAGVVAAVEGVPVMAWDKGSMAWDVSARDWDALDLRPNRNAWARRLAYAQWTPLEIRLGDCWHHLRRHAVRIT